MKLKLKNRIYLGFIATSLISLAMVMVSTLAFVYSNNNFKAFVESAKQSRQIFLITQQLSEIQRLALTFTYEGHQIAANQVNEINRNIVKRYTDEDQENSKYLQLIIQHLAVYMETFEQVKKQRQIQSDLVYNKIRHSASEAEKHFRFFMDNGMHKANLQQQLNNQHMLNTLLLIEKNAMRYFDSLNPKYIIAAKNAILEVNTYLNGLDTDQKTIAETIAEMHRYEGIFLEAVQRTRGYLFLVNVVMSAEAYEIIYLSKRNNERLNNEMLGIEDDSLNMMDTIIKVIIISGIVFLFSIILLSVLIGRSITEPISSLTTTFNALAKGSLETQIPTYPIADEIGALTQAATVFKEKNQQTEILLAKQQKLTQDLERSNDELEQFVYTVSHDLKSPLVTSMGFIGIIQKLVEAGKMDLAISKLDRVVQANRRMSQLINDLLELSRVGRVDQEKKSLDLNVVLENLRLNFETQLNKKAIQLAIDPDMPTIYANESRVLQVFENLLSNALKYAENPDGAIIRFGFINEKDYNLVFVKDNGPGIEAEYHEKIFGLFYRLNNEKEGTGIGLAVAAKVMKFHDGSIWVESTPGQGATFWLKFPKIVST